MNKIENDEIIPSIIEMNHKDIARKMKILEMRDKRQGKTPPEKGSKEY